MKTSSTPILGLFVCLEYAKYEEETIEIDRYPNLLSNQNSKSGKKKNEEDKKLKYISCKFTLNAQNRVVDEREREWFLSGD